MIMVSRKFSTLTSAFLFCGLVAAPAWGDSHMSDDAVLAAVKRQSEAFKARDVDALIANMKDDFTAYRMSDDGPMRVIEGREQAAERLSRTFSQASSYLSSEIPETLVVKDLVVQVELDTFQTEDGPQTFTTLAIYHVKDGKMWRSYNFRLPE